MTRADVGLLGSYNKWLKSPFETFYVGGDGMSGERIIFFIFKSVSLIYKIKLYTNIDV